MAQRGHPQGQPRRDFPNSLPASPGSSCLRTTSEGSEVDLGSSQGAQASQAALQTSKQASAPPKAPAKNAGQQEELQREEEQPQPCPNRPSRPHNCPPIPGGNLGKKEGIH